MSCLLEWCESIGLGQYHQQLRDIYEFESADIIAELDNDDLKQLTKDLRMSLNEKGKFLKALKQLKQAEEEKEKEKEPQKSKEPNPQRELREMKNLKGQQLVGWGGKKQKGVEYKSLLVIGATGAGKSTLLNSMVTYLHDVEIDEPVRYGLKPREKHTLGAQAQSQTSLVTPYHIKTPKYPFGVTLVDTPGYGDTGGMKVDMEHTKKIKEFFEKDVDSIHAVCIVVSACNPRLTKTQEYVFRQVVNIFGKDIEDNIMILFTFADASTPPTLSAIKAAKLPFKDWFKLNNSAFFIDETESKNLKFLEQYWNMGYEAFDDLFKAIAVLPCRSLKLTREVLKRREQLQVSIEYLHNNTQNGMNKLNQLSNLVKQVQIHQEAINRNQKFTLETTEMVNEKVYVSHFSTICPTCCQTCHEVCCYDDGPGKQFCSAMESDGRCRVCRLKCGWNVHRNLGYIYKMVERKKYVTDESLRAQYTNAKSELSATDQILNKLAVELIDQNCSVQASIDSMRSCVNELQRIALEPNVLESDDYFDLLIDGEKSDRKRGWEDRVRGLKILKKQNQLTRQVMQPGYDPWQKERESYGDAIRIVQERQPSNNNSGNQKCLIM